jgi:hypothetical protein
MAIVLAAGILWIPAGLMSAHPSDDRSWPILWTACAASLIATAVAFHRHRLAKQARGLARRLDSLKKELGDLRTSYEHELVSRGSDERERQAGSAMPFMVIPRSDVVAI